MTSVAVRAVAVQTVQPLPPTASPSPYLPPKQWRDCPRLADLISCFLSQEFNTLTHSYLPLCLLSDNVSHLSYSIISRQVMFLMADIDCRSSRKSHSDSTSYSQAPFLSEQSERDTSSGNIPKGSTPRGNGSAPRVVHSVLETRETTAYSLITGKGEWPVLYGMFHAFALFSLYSLSLSSFSLTSPHSFPSPSL